MEIFSNLFSLFRKLVKQFQFKKKEEDDLQ